MVSKTAPEGDISILEAVLPKDPSADTTAVPERPPDESVPADSEKAPDEPAAAEDNQKADKPAETEEESPSPAISTHGLPPFHPGHDSNGGTSKAQSTDDQSTEDEDAKFDKRLQKRTVEIRRYLNLDYTDYNDVDGWGDLLRYKDVPRKSAADIPSTKPDFFRQILDTRNVGSSHDRSWFTGSNYGSRGRYGAQQHREHAGGCTRA
jgi:hypothetical protein